MNLYKASDGFFRFLGMSAVPDTESANYAENSTMAFKNAENDFLTDIRLTEVMNTESVNIPKGFVKAAFLREYTGSAETVYFPAASAASGVNLQGAAILLVAETLAEHEKNMSADARALTARDLTGSTREAVMIDIEKNIGAAWKNGLRIFETIAAAPIQSLPKLIITAGEENEMSAAVEAPYKVRQADKSSVKNVPGNIYGEAVQTQAASAVSAGPALICGGIMDTRVLREKITSAQSAENRVINPAMSILTESSGSAAIPVTAQPISQTAVMPPRGIDNEYRTIEPTRTMTYTFEPREYSFEPQEYSAAVQADKPPLVFGEMLQIPSAGEAAVGMTGEAAGRAAWGALTAFAPERISAKELNRLREQAAAGTEKQAEERIIKEIRAGALNTLTALNTAPDTDNVINSLAEALRQAAETGVEGVYR